MVINLIKLEKNRKQEYKILNKKSYSEFFFFSILFVDPEGQSDALGVGINRHHLSNSCGRPCVCRPALVHGHGEGCSR